jgi:methylmalonyl-CoA mutase N-terminal domain/subunit
LAAVLGGVQHIGTLSIDEALSTPSADSARLAVRTQQILAYEAKLGDVADPLGGSHYVEWLTDRLAIQIAAELKKIDNMGGALAAIRSGYLQRTTQERAYRYQQEIELGDRTVVGVNAFVADDKSSTGGVDPFVVSDRSETRQTERLADLRRTRNGPVVSDALLSLEAAAREPTRNLMGPIKDAVASYATVGEICKTLGTVFGSWETEGALI